METVEIKKLLWEDILDLAKQGNEAIRCDQPEEFGKLFFRQRVAQRLYSDFENMERSSKHKIFISCAFKATGYLPMAEELVGEEGFDVKVAIEPTEGKDGPLEGVLDEIARCSVFISILTPKHELKDGKFVPGVWMLEERGMALGLGKRVYCVCDERIQKEFINAVNPKSYYYEFGEQPEKTFERAMKKALKEIKIDITTNALDINTEPDYSIFDL
jgi:hypothetical protein